MQLWQKDTTKINDSGKPMSLILGFSLASLRVCSSAVPTVRVDTIIAGKVSCGCPRRRRFHRSHQLSSSSVSAWACRVVCHPGRPAFWCRVIMKACANTLPQCLALPHFSCRDLIVSVFCRQILEPMQIIN